MITIVVPVYNVEKYLCRCVDSILNQTYKEFEIILVDDGSTDSSGEICDSYSEKSEKIRVIHKKNSGPSIARNTGIETAVGNYITYIDSDDVVHPDYLKELYELLVRNDAELSCCNFSFFSDEKEPDFELDKTYQEFVLSGVDAMEGMLYGRFHGTSACAILMKTEMAKANKFPPKKYHEDDLISFKYFYSASKVAVTYEPMYFYFQRPGSIMHCKYGQIAIDELDAADYIVDVCTNDYKAAIGGAVFKKFSNYSDVLFTYPDLKKLDIVTYRRIKKELQKTSALIARDCNVGNRRRLSAFVCKYFGIRLYILFHKII